MLAIYKVFSELDPQATQIPANPWLIRLEFDRKKIIKHKITMDDINRILKRNFPESILMFCDDNAGKLVFRVRMPFNTSQRADDDLLLLKDRMKSIREINIKGVEGISRVYTPTEVAVYNKEGTAFVERKEFKMVADGSNLFDILMETGVDATRTYSIDPNEMYSIFGIEAARFMIEDQLKGVLRASKAEPSPRHIALLCDKMNAQGDFMSVNRFGLKKENIGPLAKCSFEQTTDQLKLASMFGEFDNIKGVSSNIMVGQVPKCGTGDSEIMLDEEMLLNTLSESIEKSVQDDVTNVENIEGFFESSKYCDDNANIKFNIHDIKEDDILLEDLPMIGVE
jgi:DNA-directed RNA polymerase II subunit RPB1